MAKIFKVTVYSDLTGETKWVKFFHDEAKAEAYADNNWDSENLKGGGFNRTSIESLAA